MRIHPAPRHTLGRNFGGLMPKNIVICCDGPGNEIGSTISNALKLYTILQKSDQQRVYYNPGVGTIGQQNAWQRLKQEARGVFGLATG
jgi:uncharacterized protein (DUF2235 family)